MMSAIFSIIKWKVNSKTRTLFLAFNKEYRTKYVNIQRLNSVAFSKQYLLRRKFLINILLAHGFRDSSFFLFRLIPFNHKIYHKVKQAGKVKTKSKGSNVNTYKRQRIFSSLLKDSLSH